MRTEHDLMAALMSLEPCAPDESAVLRSVRRRVARRRLLRAGGAAGVTGLAAAVAVAAVATGIKPGPVVASGHHQPPVPKTRALSAHTAAYIVRHAAAAEAAAARMIQVTRDHAGVTYLSVATQQTLFIDSRRTSHGQPLMASADRIKGTTYTDTLIDYKDRAYTVDSASTLDGGSWGAKGMVIGSRLPGVTASDPASAYAAALRKGFIKVIGYRKLDGRQTILIKVDFEKLKRRSCKADHLVACTKHLNQPPRPGTCKVPPQPVTEVWLDASTYQEVQEAELDPKSAMYRLHKGRILWACYRVTRWSAKTTRVGWLPPTKHNLARLRLIPPPGFTQVSSQQMGRYLGPYS